MKKRPYCFNCQHWSRDHEYTTDGWCYRYQFKADAEENCEKHLPLESETSDNQKNNHD